MKKHLLTLLSALAFALPVAAQTTAADETAIQVQDFAVFVDPPTGFVFVKMPAGWKFVGKVDHATVASLPASVFTSLLPAGERDSIDVAKRTPAESGKHPGKG
jgi:hypothetical protein